MRKKQNMLVGATLVLSILLSGCGNGAQTAPAVDSPPQSTVASETAAPAPATAPPQVTIQLDYDYVRALLKDNRLQITILGDKSTGMMLDYWNKIRFDEPYDVSGLTGTYTDLFIGTIGQDTWPYAFLLRDDATVECVPIADPLYETDHGQFAEVAFRSIGVLPGVSNVVSFREGSIESGDGSGYMTVFAEAADGAAYDLSFPILFVQQPEDAPASEGDSLQMLTENAEIAQHIAQGMKPWSTGEFQFMYGEYGRLFSLGTDREQQLAREMLYGIGASGAIYSYGRGIETCTPVNELAALYAGADSYSDLFAIITDPNDPVYQQFKNQNDVEFIGTPVVSLEKTEPVLLMPLKNGMRLKVELMADDSGNYYTEVTDSFFDGTVSRTNPCLIGVTLSETNSALRVTASWYDGFDNLVAVWYAIYNQGDPYYRQYISGSYSAPPNG